jgi:cytochrome P450
MQRNARKEFRFSDGTLLPVGSKVGAPSRILHYDPEIYDNPDEFDGFRFLDPKYHDSKERVPTSTTINFHVFGHGRHPWSDYLLG